MELWVRAVYIIKHENSCLEATPGYSLSICFNWSLPPMAMEYTKHFLSVLATLLLLHSHGLLPSTSALAQLLPIVSSRRTQVYIVHVQHPKGSTNHLTAEERDEWYRSFLPNATLDSGEPRMVHTYEVVISGFAARLTPEEAEAMEFRDGFVLAHPERIHPLHTTYTPKLLGLDQYNSLWKSSNQGEGVIIAVLDTGILANHTSFADTLQLPSPPLKWRGRCDLPAGSGTCNNKLIGAQLFVHGKKPTTIDIEGHGTHVAGIAAGSPLYGANVNGLSRGTASGMAPRAHLAVYKVCIFGGCPDSASLKGIDRAIIDGVDIIQISNGAPSEFHLSGNIKGSFRALEKGILTVCAAGNSGPFPSLISNDAPWILTVGAATIDRSNPALLKLGNGMELAGQSAYHPNPSGALDLPLFYPGANSKQAAVLTCQAGSLAGLNVTGKMVICGNGFTFPSDKSKLVKAAGGAAIIVVNQISQGDTLSSDPFVIPGILISYTDALKLIDYTNNEPNPTGSITFKDTELGVRPSPMVAAFSSRGPSLLNGGILKPDIIAPGAAILSAWPFDVGPNQTGFASAGNSDTFTFVSGTSNAAPHVTGISSLLKKIHPDWTPAMIKSAIMTTAYTNDRSGSKIVDGISKSGGPANAFAVGAGHVNPSAAEDPGLVYDTPIKDYISYLCGLKGITKVQIVAIANRPIACSVKIAAEELNYPSISASMGTSGPSKTITRTMGTSGPSKTITRTATNVGAENSIYTVTVVEPKGVKVEVNPKTLQFGGIGDRKSFTVEISLTGSPPTKNDVWEGSLTWASGKYQVTSPIVVTE